MAKITIKQAAKPTYADLERRIHDLEATIQRREEFVPHVCGTERNIGRKIVVGLFNDANMSMNVSAR
jgi:hypothetical protein